jgi:hypothetical protein
MLNIAPTRLHSKGVCVFDVPKSIAAFYEFLESVNGKKVQRVVFEAYLADGEPIRFKAKQVEMKEKPENLLVLRSKNKEAN